MTAPFYCDDTSRSGCPPWIACPPRPGPTAWPVRRCRIWPHRRRLHSPAAVGLPPPGMLRRAPAADAHQTAPALHVGAADSVVCSCRALLHSWASALLMSGIYAVRYRQLHIGANRLAHSGSAAELATAQGSTASCLGTCGHRYCLVSQLLPAAKVTLHACGRGTHRRTIEGSACMRPFTYQRTSADLHLS